MAEARYTIEGGKTLAVLTETAALAIAASLATEKAAQILSVRCKFSAAPTTAGDFTVTRNAGAGAGYDTVEYTVDPSVAATVSISWTPDSELWLVPGDSLDVAYTNADTRTYGVEIVIREEP